MARITGQFVDSQGRALVAASVTFTARDALLVAGSRVIIPTLVTVQTDSLGQLSVASNNAPSLQPGVYQVDSGAADFAIAVPDDNNTYDITQVAMATLTYTPPALSGSSGGGRGTDAVTHGIGAPNGVVSGRPGDRYSDLTDPNNPIDYIKTTGTDTTTGWI